MLSSKDVLRAVKAASWATTQELEAFLAQVEPVEPAELLKMLELVAERGIDASLARRRSAAFARLATGVRGDDLGPAYVRALKSADAQVRTMLGTLILGVESVAAHGELCAMLRSSDADLRRTVAGVLKRVGGTTVFSTLTTMCGEPDLIGRLEVVDALVSKWAHRAVPGLASVVRVGKPIERAHVLRLLGDTTLMASDLDGARAAIEIGLGDQDERVVATAITAFCRSCSEDQYFTFIEPTFAWPSVTVVRAAVDGLRRFSSERAVQVLAARFHAGPDPIREAVLDVLEALGSDEAVVGLVRAMHHPSSALRARAAEALHKVVNEARIDVPRALVHLISSRDASVARTGITMAKRLDDGRGGLVAELARRLHDAEHWLRERATEPLLEIGGARLVPLALGYLDDPSDLVRRWAIDLLARLGDRSVVPALLRAATSDADWWARERAIEALGSLGDARLAGHLLELAAADDRCAIVVLGALAALGAREAAAQAAGYATHARSNVARAAIECLVALDARDQAPAVQAAAEAGDAPLRAFAREVLVGWEVTSSGRAEGGAERRLSLLDRLLMGLVRAQGDDLLLYSGATPFVKRHGVVAPLVRNVFTAEQVEAMLMPLLSPTQRRSFADIDDVDLSHEVRGENLRFRVNVFRQAGGPCAVFRIIKADVPTLESLGLPPVVGSFADMTSGLVLVGGPTGSGKSTTLAAIIDQINRTRGGHIVTLEDPIEVVHPRKTCVVNQREVGTHTRSFEAALRSALREDPDVILCGEMRDLATISFAVTAAETGHLVFGTVHTVSADSSIDRLINAFPAGQHAQIRAMLADTLRAVACQHLLRRKGSPGREIAVEVMVNNDAVANLIRKGKTYQLSSVVQMSRDLGMQSMDSEILRLLGEGRIHEDEAFLKINDKALIAQWRAGIDGAATARVQVIGLTPSSSSAAVTQVSASGNPGSSPPASSGGSSQRPAVSSPSQPPSSSSRPSDPGSPTGGRPSSGTRPATESSPSLLDKALSSLRGKGG